MLVRLPSTGVPGLDQGAVVELLKPVYGLADAPKAWYDTLCAALCELGCKQSELDPCVFHYHRGGKAMGILAFHVDDILFGGTEEFLQDVMGRLRARFPIKHWKVGQGEFLGKQLIQQGKRAFMSDSKSTPRRLSAFR